MPKRYLAKTGELEQEHIMRRWLQKLRDIRTAGSPFSFYASILPDEAFVAVGDLHGRADLLTLMLAKLRKTCPDMPVVFVGDYIDRGPDSVSVLARLQALSRDAVVPVHCLLGNHEEMCLQFLDNPRQRGQRWLHYGGLDTLRAYGIHGATPATSGLQLVALRDALARAMGAGLIDWLETRPVLWRSGNILATHAGADPAKPPQDQKRETLLWGHPDFRNNQRQDGEWVVHGHFIVPRPKAWQGRIAIDTGAYRSGCLSAAVIMPGMIDFMTVQGQPGRRIPERMVR